MNSYILAKYNWYKQIEKFFIDNHLDWDDFPGLKEEIDEFFAFLQQFENSKNLSEANTKGVTENKNNVFTKMSTLSLEIAGKAKVWAKKTKNSVAANAFDVVAHDFSINQSKSVDLASSIHKMADDNKIELVKYRVTDLLLTTLKDLVDSAKNEIGTPGAEKDKISTSLHELKPLTHTIGDTLENIAGLMLDFKESKPKLYNGFVTINKMDDPRTRYTKVLGKVTTADGKPLVNYLVKIKELEGEQDLTDLEGDYEIEEFKGGEYTLQVFDENGKLIKEEIFKVLTGKKVGVNVVI
jgi:hypothetical protein